MPRLARPWALGPSAIHGIGVFSARDMSPGQRVGRIYAEPLGPVEQLTSLPMTGLILRNLNVITGHEELTIYAVTAGFPYWYLNYSRDPNVQLRGRSEIITTRPIFKGDELFMPFLNIGGIV